MHNLVLPCMGTDIVEGVIVRISKNITCPFLTQEKKDYWMRLVCHWVKFSRTTTRSLIIFLCVFARCKWVRIFENYSCREKGKVPFWVDGFWLFCPFLKDHILKFLNFCISEELNSPITSWKVHVNWSRVLLATSPFLVTFVTFSWSVTYENHEWVIHIGTLTKMRCCKRFYD